MLKICLDGFALWGIFLNLNTWLDILSLLSWHYVQNQRR